MHDPFPSVVKLAPPGGVLLEKPRPLLASGW